MGAAVFDFYQNICEFLPKKNLHILYNLNLADQTCAYEDQTGLYNFVYN